MKTIGVTGGIGSGKSSVCALFEQWGGVLVDADRVGHDAIEDPEVKTALSRAFGDDILDDGGSILRRKLGTRAFESDETRRRLTDIVWPEIGKRMKQRVESERKKGTDILVIEASLLLERGDPEQLYESVVVVTAPEDVRIKRTMARDGVSEDDVRRRMQHQMPEEEKVGHADFVILNDASEETMAARAREVWESLIERKDSETE